MAVAGVPTELGTEKVSRLLRQYAVPAIIAMTASSLYNMVDSIFIGHGVGKFAIAGLALTFPMMNLGAAFGALVGVGASATISMLLGQKNYDMAQKVLGNVVTLNTIIGLVYTIVFMIFLDPILYFFGASENTIGYARDYMVIILLGNIITHMYLGLNAVMRSAGMPKKAMYATIFTVIINAILDPLFIYVLDWGIKGAAIATIIAQTLALCWIVKIFSNRNLVIHFKKGIYKLKKRIVKDVISIGMAPFFMNTAACLIVILINQGLQRHGGDLAIGAYGIVNRVSFVFVMIVLGLNQGMQPIVGFNYGAKQFLRVKEALKLTILYATAIMTLGFLLAEIFPRQIVMIFTTDEELIQQAIKGMAGKSVFMSLTRQLLFLLPGLLIFPYFFQDNGIWMSMPISDGLSSLVAFIMLYNQMKKFKTVQ